MPDGIRVVLVDDDPSILRAYSRVLGGHGMIVA